MYEHIKQPLLPKNKFYLRMVRSCLLALIVLAVTLLFGTVGFRIAEHYPWIDCLLNSIMIMTGVGTLGVLNTSAGKLFTGFYSIVSTLVFFTILAIIFTPLLHRLMHKLHLDLEKDRQ
jgi:hypothetical protein